MNENRNENGVVHENGNGSENHEKDSSEKSKVAVIRCETYDSEAVYQAVKEGIQLIGGLESLFSKEEAILLKPNLLARADPELAKTTHPSVFRGVARLFRETGYKHLTYGDSPGQVLNPAKVAEGCGLAKEAEAYQIPLGEFTRGKTVNFPEGHLCKQFEVSQAVLDADGIVSICKMKTHQLERITGGVKNSLGCVYGLNKGVSHAKFPNAEQFGQMLVDLNLLLPVKLFVMDGIVAMEGNGPASGTPIQMGVILVSADPVALDAVFCRLIHLEPELVPTIRYGGEAGLGRYRDDEIELLGETDLTSLEKPDFDVFRNEIAQKKWDKLKLLRGIALKKPVIDQKRCVRCGACVKACPLDEKAIAFPSQDHKDVPRYHYSRCIRCYCCQEMCPEKAIGVKTPLLARLLVYR